MVYLARLNKSFDFPKQVILKILQPIKESSKVTLKFPKQCICRLANRKSQLKKTFFEHFSKQKQTNIREDMTFLEKQKTYNQKEYTYQFIIMYANLKY